MVPNPHEKWVASSTPGMVTPEQTALWQAGLEWFVATAPVVPASDSVQLPAPERKETDESNVA